MAGLIDKLNTILEGKNAIKAAFEAKEVVTGNTLQSFADTIQGLNLGMKIESGVIMPASASVLVFDSELLSGNYFLVIEAENPTSSCIGAAVAYRMSDTTVGVVLNERRSGNPANTLDAKNTITETTLSINRRTSSYSWIVGANYKYQIISL